jgi:hypothetical protein
MFYILHAELEIPGFFPNLLKGKISGNIDLIQVHGAKPPFGSMS